MKPIEQPAKNGAPIPAKDLIDPIAYAWRELHKSPLPEVLKKR